MALAACQTDSFLRELDTKVVACEKSTDKKLHKGKFLVQLEDTVLFPEGGGQPADHGTIASVNVTHVYRDANADIIHVCDAPLTVGDAVKVLLDWDRRWDHMQQHTGQHLASAVAFDAFQLETVGWSLGERVSSIEFASETITQDTLDALETAINLPIQQGLSVKMKLKDDHERESGDGGGDGAGEVRSRGVNNGGKVPVRLIEIDGLDLNTCCGTHLATTAQIQLFKVLGTQRARKGTTRVGFVAGERVRKYMQAMFERQQAITRITTKEPEQHVDYVSTLMSSNLAKGKEVTSLKTAISRITIAALLDASQGKESICCHVVVGDGKGLSDAGDLGLLASELTKQSADTIGLFTIRASEKEEAGSFLLSGPKDAVKSIGPKVAETVSGRGGGRPGRYQGKATAMSVDNLASAFGLLSVTPPDA